MGGGYSSRNSLVVLSSCVFSWRFAVETRDITLDLIGVHRRFWSICYPCWLTLETLLAPCQLEHGLSRRMHLTPFWKLRTRWIPCADIGVRKRPRMLLTVRVLHLERIVSLLTLLQVWIFIRQLW